MDSLDNKILNILQTNGRISIKDMSEMVHMSAPALKERILKMEDAGIIEGYTVRINMPKAGRKIHAIIEIRFRRDQRSRFKEILGSTNAIIKGYLPIDGGIEAFLEVYTADIEELRLVQASLYEIGDTTTFIISNELLKDAPYEFT